MIWSTDNQWSNDQEISHPDSNPILSDQRSAYYTSRFQFPFRSRIMNPIIAHSTHPEQLKIHSEESHIKKFSECSYPKRILSDDINATTFQPIVEPEEKQPKTSNILQTGRIWASKTRLILLLSATWSNSSVWPISAHTTQGNLFPERLHQVNPSQRLQTRYKCS